MRAALSLYLPTWATDLANRRLSRQGDGTRPDHVLLVAIDGQKQVVAHRCARSALAGVHPGMTLAHARALLPIQGVHTDNDDPARQLDALRSLALWATRFSPIVAIDPPDGLLMDITGCAHLVGGERALVQRIWTGARRLGFTSRVAAASTLACAWAIARFGRRDRSFVPPGREREALGPLPIEALCPDDDALAALHEIGIERVEHLVGLCRAHLPSRFGPDMLLRLDRALGQAIESIDPIHAPEVPRAEQVFDGPTTHMESIHVAARAVLADLCRTLRRLERGVRLLEVTLPRSDADPAIFSLKLSRPTRNPRHLWSLLHPRLERVNLGFGIEGVGLIARRTGRLRHEQADLARDGAAPDGPSPAESRRQTAELVDTLANRLGPHAVVRPELVESHIPERAFRLAPPDAKPPAGAIAPVDRPTLLLAHPEPVRVLAICPDGPIAGFTWRGRAHSVQACRGPERIAPEWWRDNPEPARDWFQVQDEAGRWLWIYREVGSDRWFLHGLWA